ncbi:aldehyde dehydrogenase family protein [Polynucleobacter kasalickyi]|uniref:Aldehyde dehydrogenase n=1 Tax=Polynucleobacter kasalickyi TaxID=1938817 RepID=A0A1W1ZQS1_9BURK|nr:aldehyde dehydrogenase family protein [Polynucleobacter kasalickyi]SMC50754.1 coniferyl-aldehyde dehydrogenase [Polynucleobacter kasalickyi]
MNPFLYDFDLARQTYLQDPFPTLTVRRDRINRLLTMLNENEENLCKVIQADFHYRNTIETQLAEISMIRSAAKFNLKNLAKWTAKRKVITPSYLRPSQSYIMPQPKGIVGIMSPWNYPLALALIPVIAAFAAGNRVWLKPSERSARTSGYLAVLIQQYFHPSEFTIITGGPEISKHFSELPFHHLLFTGSTQTGQLVAKAAAENLTPVTLELGGKSPAIIEASANLADACSRIIYGKLFNAGQTCIAPDYLLVPHHLIDSCIKELQKSLLKQYPNDEGLTHPIDQNQLTRWQYLVQDAAQRGCKTIPLANEEWLKQFPFMPMLVLQPTSQSAVMSEEIFGPILPILGYDKLQDAYDFIQQRPNPLCIYYFGKSSESISQLLNQTKSGGVTLNDTLLHYSNPYLPFGGVGDSGMGSYHGKFGFDTFSHLKSVMTMKGFMGIKALGGTKMAHPPYGNRIKKLLKVL